MIRSSLLQFSRTLTPLGAGLVLVLMCPPASANASLYAVAALPPYEWKGDCSLCHQGAIGLQGTATNPFAESLKSRGIGGSSTGAELTQILDAWDDTDSDGDGKSDVEELLTQGDPNESSGAAPKRAVVARYGCLSVANGETQGAAWGWTLIAGFCWWRRRSTRA